MKRETEIGLAAAGGMGSKYDEACKALFQNKEIIAPVLKEVVPEYRNSTVEEIIRCIDADSIRDIPVDEISARAGQCPTEMGSVSDKLIRYDTHFKAINPMLSDEAMCIQLHIDLEVQNNYRPTNPSYPIIKRGIYYAAREISYQLGVLMERTDYGSIQKVYSIWICNERIPKKLQNTVTMYSIKKTDMIGVTNEPEEDYDLMNVIIIRRG
ncbi:MAG: Rpn family recombination-promoting nuclease/putative transposase, partial [Lachnospiraceae bacterium]|nr:Rpn family recombination-promoting nuclease/putative transposase [Lachnospiraceae bacterium]